MFCFHTIGVFLDALHKTVSANDSGNEREPAGFQGNGPSNTRENEKVFNKDSSGVFDAAGKRSFVSEKATGENTRSHTHGCGKRRQRTKPVLMASASKEKFIFNR